MGRELKIFKAMFHFEGGEGEQNKRFLFYSFIFFLIPIAVISYITEMHITQLAEDLGTSYSMNWVMVTWKVLWQATLCSVIVYFLAKLREEYK